MTAAAIRDALAADIRDGRFAAAGRLPGELAHRARFGAARGTVRSALAALRREGLIETRNGAGSFPTPLAARRTGLVGLVIPDCARMAFFGIVRDRMEAIAARAGLRVRFESASAPDPDAAAADILEKARRLVADRAEGVVFRPFLDARHEDANRKIAEIFRNAGTPVVLLDSDIAAPPDRSGFDLVAVNNVNAGRRIAGHLFARGYRRVAFLLGRRGSAPNANWRNRLFGLAGELALRGAGRAVRTLRFDPEDLPALARAMRGPDRPDAIVCGNDEAAAALLAALARIGLLAPRDVGVVGFDDLECSRTSSPPLTTVRQPAGLLAREAIRALLARIRHPEAIPSETFLPAPLVARESTEKRRASARKRTPGTRDGARTPTCRPRGVRESPGT